jgi:hypothetical protein
MAEVIKPVVNVKPIVEKPASREASRAVASPAQIREAGLLLQNAVAAWNTSVAAQAAAIDDINTAVAAMDFKGLDNALPTQADLKAQVVAFNALSATFATKPVLTSNLTAALAAVNS